jgi:hypothetical protein
MPNHKIDMDEVYRDEGRERYLRAQRSFEFNQIAERTR